VSYKAVALDNEKNMDKVLKAMDKAAKEAGKTAKTAAATAGAGKAEQKLKENQAKATISDMRKVVTQIVPAIESAMLSGASKMLSLISSAAGAKDKDQD
jgi:L-fucose isomerase-like protein